jgi:hypothetical protein
VTFQGEVFHWSKHYEFLKFLDLPVRTGWFSDRSATYLAAGRPVITQETGFSNILPTGKGRSASRRWTKLSRPSKQLSPTTTVTAAPHRRWHGSFSTTTLC